MTAALRLAPASALLHRARPARGLCAMAAWSPLGAPPAELRLDVTLPTGQSFRWKKVADHGPGPEYLGVVAGRGVRLRETPSDVLWRVVAREPAAAAAAAAAPAAAAAADAAALRDYFQLGTPLAPLVAGWAAADARFASLAPRLGGARCLRQDPVECLFAFICSSNNHISRIGGMVERLCTRYGAPLVPDAVADGSDAAPLPPLHAFPTLDALLGATEEELRGAGFGYRAKFVVGAAAAVAAAGGRPWLEALRGASRDDALAALAALPGVGPKVAACVALFSLDQPSCVPVDTHVWQLALRHYTPHLRGRAVNAKTMAEVQGALAARFGPYAGWAHNTLFIAELASVRGRLAPGGAGDAGASAGAASEEEADEGLAAAPPPVTPPKGDDAAAAAAGGRKRRRPVQRVSPR